MAAGPAAAGPVPTNRADELKARIVGTPHGTFGHLRIITFQDQDINAFLNEVIRLLGLMRLRHENSNSGTMRSPA